MSGNSRQKSEVFVCEKTDILKGITMIEASAGTGKTYTIAMLVVRLVVEYGVPVEKILIVTFTKAATQELAERIRTRLKQVQTLLGGKGGGRGDFVLENWCETIRAKAKACERIAAALLNMDMAPIFTIHGFCQRALREHALVAGNVFDLEVIPDLSTLQAEIREDFWRKTIYPLSGRVCAALLNVFSTPASLYNSVFSSATCFTRIEPDCCSLDEAARLFTEEYQNMADSWCKEHRQLYYRFTDLVETGKLKKDFNERFGQWWKTVDGYFTGRDDIFPDNLEWLQNRGFYEQIHGNRVRGTKKDQLVAELALPDRAVSTFLAAQQTLVLSLRYNFAVFFQNELMARLKNAGSISYDEIINGLNRALHRENGNELCQVLAEQYEAALIDEFQDTDVQQWQIFARIFADESHFLYLIGDPKQSIYKFRGADINSYFQARQRADRLLTLKTNYRSHPAMVHAVNSLFVEKEKPFYYDEQRLPFEEVEIDPEKDVCFLENDHGRAASLVLCQLCEHPGKKAGKHTGRWGGTDAAGRIRSFVVHETVRILGGGLRFSEQQQDGGVRRRLLNPSDIAVLVRNNTHAEEYREALAAAHVPAVVTSKNSVLTSPEAQELFLLLQAVFEPGNERLLKNCMTLPWFGFTADELLVIWQDPEQIADVQERFAAYFVNWCQGGVMLMLQNVLDQEEVYENLGKTGRTERKIANINHLVEILQKTESDYKYSPLQLLDWLQKKMINPPGEDELRLEKDDKSVNIITMHGAKGLEYAIVFCPYLWYKQAGEENRDSLPCFDAGGSVLDLGSAQFAKRKDELHFERSAEEMRLLYVAVTRAKYRCYLTWADVRGVSGKTVDSWNSALGYLLFSEEAADFSTQTHILQKWAEKAGGKHLIFSGKEKVGTYTAGDITEVNLLAWKNNRKKLVPPWKISSYSALSASSLRENAGRNGLPLRVEDASESVPFAQLPSGAHFGNVVHDLFENISFTAFQQPKRLVEVTGNCCQKYGVHISDDERWLLIRMLQEVVNTPIELILSSRKNTVTLAELAPENCLREMNFYFHLKQGKTKEINRILAADKTVLELIEEDITGFLVGFIDLVFEHDGRYYIADYKTNNLGDTVADYRSDRLITAMAAHSYGLQLWIYALVLHLYLQSKLPGYEYERHFGGVYYLFVRGMPSGGGIYASRPDFATLMQLAACLGEGR